MTNKPTVTFADLGLSSELLHSIIDAGYDKPTPIQEKSIPYVLMGRDVLGGAQTGTGKTASYALPIIDILDNGTTKARLPRALVLAPTRELAQQIANNFSLYAKRHSLKHLTLIGGESMGDQERALDANPDVLIATPGRLLDLFERGIILLSGVKILVIDEADRMLDMGFIPDVERIVSLLPKIRQTLFFSATLGSEIRSLAEKFLINPKEVSVAPSATLALNIEHTMLRVNQNEKRKVLLELITKTDVQVAIIFCNRKRDVTSLTEVLKKKGLRAGGLHGDMHQHNRTNMLESFKNGEISLLVSSDVAGRGLDIESVSHVFNFDVPIHAEDYVHRIGRTGRAGRKGKAITLVTTEDTKFIAAIRKLTGQELKIISKLKNEISEPQKVNKLNVKPKNHHDNKVNLTNTVKETPNNRSKSKPKINSSKESVSTNSNQNLNDEKVLGMGSHVPDFLK